MTHVLRAYTPGEDHRTLCLFLERFLAPRGDCSARTPWQHQVYDKPSAGVFTDADFLNTSLFAIWNWRLQVERCMCPPSLTWSWNKAVWRLFSDRSETVRIRASSSGWQSEDRKPGLLPDLHSEEEMESEEDLVSDVPPRLKVVTIPLKWSQLMPLSLKPQLLAIPPLGTSS